MTLPANTKVTPLIFKAIKRDYRLGLDKIDLELKYKLSHMTVHKVIKANKYAEYRSKKK